VRGREFDLFVPGVPVPQGSKFLWKGRMIEKNSHRLHKWRTTIAEAVIGRGWHFDARLVGPVGVMLTFYLARPKAHYGTGRNAGVLKPDAPIFHTGTPDVDKLVRGVLDALTQARVWRDDCQVASLFADKRYAEQTGVRVVLFTPVSEAP
jgi:crossover junction endodeoxyribonuclease RusA